MLIKQDVEQIIVVNSANNKKEYEKMPGVIKVIDDFKELL